MKSAVGSGRLRESRSNCSYIIDMSGAKHRTAQSRGWQAGGIRRMNMFTSVAGRFLSWLSSRLSSESDKFY